MAMPPMDSTPGMSLEELAERVATWLPALPTLGQQLRGALEQIEQSVLPVCLNFQNIARAARASSDQLGEALGQEGNDVLGQAVHKLDKLMTCLIQFNENTLSQLNRLASISKQIGEMLRALNEVESVASSLQILAINARIEATRAGQQGVAFAVVARETARLSRHASLFCSRMRDTTESLYKFVLQTTQENGSHRLGDPEQLSHIKDEIEAVANTLTASNRRMRELVSHSLEADRQLARHINDAVMHLQFQDAVNQRVLHVVETMEQMESALSGEDVSMSCDPRVELAARYTMQAQRETHASLAASCVEISTASDSGSVELF